MIFLNALLLAAFAFQPMRQLIVFYKSPNSRPTKSETAGILLAVAAASAYAIVLMALSYFY